MINEPPLIEWRQTQQLLLSTQRYFLQSFMQMSYSVLQVFPE